MHIKIHLNFEFSIRLFNQFGAKGYIINFLFEIFEVGNAVLDIRAIYSILLIEISLVWIDVLGAKTI